MAITIAHDAQTAAAATASLTGQPAATAGNTIYVFVAQNLTTSAPKGKDNISGETGWTVETTKSLYNSSASSLWVMKKTAVGSETEYNPVAGSGGNIQGLCYFELTGASESLEVLVNTDNGAAVKTLTSGSVTTANASDIILAALAAGDGATGAVSAWTGTGPATSIASTSTRCLGGFYKPEATLTGATFTANWATARNVGMLAIAVKPGVATIAAVTKVAFATTGPATQNQGIVNKAAVLFADSARTTVSMSPAAKTLVAFPTSAKASTLAGMVASTLVKFSDSAAASTRTGTASASRVAFTTQVSAEASAVAHAVGTTLLKFSVSSPAGKQKQKPGAPAQRVSLATGPVPLNANVAGVASTLIRLKPSAATGTRATVTAVTGFTFRDSASAVSINAASVSAKTIVRFVVTANVEKQRTIIIVAGVVNPAEQAGVVNPRSLVLGLFPGEGLIPSESLFPNSGG